MSFSLDIIFSPAILLLKWHLSVELPDAECLTDIYSQDHANSLCKILDKRKANQSNGLQESGSFNR